MLDNLQRSPETGLKNDAIDSERAEMKINNNRISYNFMTGEDYEKNRENNHLYINQSEGVMDMFSAFSDAAKRKPKPTADSNNLNSLNGHLIYFSKKNRNGAVYSRLG